MWLTRVALSWDNLLLWMVVGQCGPTKPHEKRHAMPVKHLTESAIDKWPLETGETVYLTDDNEPGFQARVRLGKSGRRSVTFLWAREKRDGKERERKYKKLGPRIPKVFGVSEARAEAERLNARWKLGEVRGETKSDGVPNVKEVWEGDVHKDGERGFRTRLHRPGKDGKPKLRPRTWEYYDNIADHIIRELGHRRIDQLTVEDVEDFHDRITRTVGYRPADAAVDLLGRMYRWWAAKNRSKIPDPTSVVDRHGTEERKFKLVPEEVELFFEVVKADPDRDLWTLIAFTGCRRNEALQAHRGQFDLDAMVWVIPEEASKNKEPQVKPLVEEVAEIVRRRGVGLLFPNTKDGVRSGVKKEWNRLREAAEGKLDHWTPHTLRKLHATTARSHAGLTEGETADLLGHRAKESQSAYAFGTDESVARAQQKVAESLRGFRTKKS